MADITDAKLLIEQVNPNGDLLSMSHLSPEAQEALLSSDISESTYRAMVGGRVNEWGRHRASDAVKCGQCVLQTFETSEAIDDVPEEYRALCNGQPTETRHFSSEVHRSSQALACTGALFALLDSAIERKNVPVTIQPYSTTMSRKKRT